MRIGFGLIAGALVLTLAVGPSISAQPDASAKVQAPPETAAVQAPPENARIQVPPSATLDLNAAVRPKGLQQSTPVGVSALSVSECQALGGVISIDQNGLCALGMYCTTIDQKQKVHMVCVSSL